MNKVGWRLVVAGAVAQALGLGIDGWRHVDDPTLASREALLTFDNIGHVLLIAGIALVLTGVGLTTLGPRVARLPQVLRIAVPLVLTLSVGGGSVLAANSSLARGHDHAAVAAAAEAPDHGHGDGTVVPDRPLDDPTRDRLAGELVAAREVAMKHPTVADAERAGYKAVTSYMPLIGAHYMRFVVVDGTFDITQPEMLLYDGTKPSSKIVGMSYYVQGGSAPEGFAGPNDHWHQHIGLCIDAEQIFVVGAEQTTTEECRRRGGVKVDGRDGWMVHAWVVPGWESPQGVFSAENAQLR